MVLSFFMAMLLHLKLNHTYTMDYEVYGGGSSLIKLYSGRNDNTTCKTS